MKNIPMEPGYPCQHRSQPIYLENPSTTYTSLHSQYSTDCKDHNRRIVSYNRFREVVKYLYPTLHLGETKTDSCNTCFR